MAIELNEEEREFLQELLETRRISLMHEIHHTASHEFKRILERQLAVLERLQSGIAMPQPSGMA